MSFLLQLVFVVRLFLLTLGQKSCGKESIPYLLSVDLSGKPELACDTPACFGPLKSSDEDEYEDDEPKMHLSAFERTATCTNKFTEMPCMNNDEWTGGVNEVNNGTHITLTMECCQFQGLNYATEYKTIVLRPGDRFVGGAVKEQNRLIAFDLIKEVRKNVSASNEISYIVNIFRMSCVPEPSQFVNKVDTNIDSGEYLSKQLGISGKRTYTSQNENGAARRGPYHRPKYYTSHDDYDYSRERNENRVRPSYSRYESRGRYSRRRYHKPSADDYDYYEAESIPAVRRAMYRRLKARFDDDQLWPIAYGAKTKSKVHGLQSFNNDLAKELSDNKLPQIYSETPAPPVVLPAADTNTYVQPQISSIPAVASIPLIPTYSIQPTYTSYGHQQQSNYIQPLAPSYSTYDTSQSSTCSESCTSSSPSCSCSMNGMFSSMQCFSAEMIVRTSKGEKRMDELVIGDLVESIDGSMVSYSPVVMFLHRKVKEPAIYLQFRTSDGNFLKITPYHLIYASKCRLQGGIKLMRAVDVKIDDCIHVVKNSALHSTQVLSIEKIEDVGIYAPLTANGNIVVNSVLTSCHSNLAAQTLQQTFFSWWQELNGYAQRIRNFIPRVFVPEKTVDGNDELPFGVEYLVTIIDLLVPVSSFM